MPLLACIVNRLLTQQDTPVVWVLGGEVLYFFLVTLTVLASRLAS